MAIITTQNGTDPRPTSKAAAILLFLMIFLYVGRVHEALGGAVRFSLIFTAITLVFCLPALSHAPLKYFRESVTLRRITYFILWVTLCVPFSRWPGGSVAALLAFLKTYAFLLLSTVILIRYRITSVAVLGYVLSLVVMLFLSIVTHSDSVRVSTITHSYDPNEMALIAVMVLPILFFSLKNATLFWKAVYAGGLGVCVIAIAYSGSRGGFSGLCVVGAYILFISPLNLLKKGVIVAVAAVVFIVAIPQENLERLTKTLNIENDYNMTSKTGRIAMWTADLKKIVQNPITGVGFGQSTTLEENEIEENEAWMEAHNSYIEIALEGGVPGFLLLFPVFLIGARRLWELRRSLDRKDPRMPLVNGLEGGLWGFFICIVFLSVAFYALSLFYFVLIEAVYKDMKGKYLIPDAAGTESARPRPPARRSRAQRA